MAAGGWRGGECSAFRARACPPRVTSTSAAGLPWAAKSFLSAATALRTSERLGWPSLLRPTGCARGDELRVKHARGASCVVGCAPRLDARDE
eukprot:1046102-Prymnesium_polylepis.2